MNQYPWGHQRPFNAYASFFRKYFGERVQKLSIDAGFSCPNRDGNKGKGGCTYCNNRAFNPSYCLPGKPIRQQLTEGMEFHLKRYKTNKFLAYFQAYSNTYAPIEILKQRYEEALQTQNVVGLVIGTRPDCVDDAILDYLAELSRDYYIIVEYGIESVYDKSLKRINRGHDFACAKEAVEKTARKGLKTGAHFIFGLPGESRQQMLDSVQIINELPLTTIKFHQLQIIRGTQMAREFETKSGDFLVFNEMADYIDYIVHFTERLKPDIMIERFAGEVSPKLILGPRWGNIRYDQVLLAIEKEFVKMNSWQGKFYSSGLPAE